MTGLIRLGPSGIEYLDYVWNFYSGCRHRQQGKCAIEKCWAEALVNRHREHYPNGFEPNFYPEAFTAPLYLKKPSRIGVAFMGDLFGDWVEPHKRKYKSGIGYGSLQYYIYEVIRHCPQHTFLFLTKNPAGLLPWSPFPDNCWVGVSATNEKAYWDATRYLHAIQAKVKYISFEPLFGSIMQNCHPYYLQNEPLAARMTEVEWLQACGINWLIIGAQTRPYKPPAIEWVRDILLAADKAGILVFMKNNLKKLIAEQNRKICDECEAGDPCHACDLVFRFRQELPG